MTDQKTSALPEATSLASTDLVYAVVGGQSRRMTVKNFGQEMTNTVDPVRDHDADPTGATDSFAKFVAADAEAAADGKILSIPPGTFLFNSDFKHIDGDQAKASWFGAGPDKTVFKFDVTTSSPRLLTAASSTDSATTVLRAEELGTGSPVSNLAALDAQTLIGCTVTLTTAADNTLFAVGDWVTVSWGIDIYDADDNLWRRSMMTRITAINAGTGDITLADPIDTEMNDDGFAPSSAKNSAIDWVNSTAYTAGDYRYDPSGTTLYKATTTGTSSGTGPADDTGVSWDQITTAFGALRDARDGRPVIQVVEDPSVGQIFEGFTIWASGATDAVMGFDARGTYGTVLRDVWFRGNIEIPMNATEHTSGPRFINCRDLSEVTAPNERSFGAYAAQDVLFDACRFKGVSANSTDALGFIEANADVALINCRAGIEKSSGLGNATFGIQVSHGSVKLLANEILGFASPLGQSATLADIVPERPDLHRVMNLKACRGNLFDIAANNFRRGWKQKQPNQNVQMWVQNSYRIWDTYDNLYTQSATLDFNPTRLVEYTFSFTPLANQTTTSVVLPSVPQQGIFDIEDILAVVMGARVKWDSAPASGSVEVDFIADSGGNTRRILSSVVAGNKIKVTDVTPTGQLFDGNGATSRLVENTISEKLAIFYDSNASAAGGTVYVSLSLLIEEGRGGDFEAV